MILPYNGAVQATREQQLARWGTFCLLRHLRKLTGSLPGRRIDSLVIAVYLRTVVSSEDGVKE